MQNSISEFATHLTSTYEREVWHYGKAKVDLIRKAINDFCGLTHLRISKQRPANINSKIKNLIKNKVSAYKKYFYNISSY